MNNLERVGLRAWSLHPTFRKKVDNAFSLIGKMLDACTCPYVAFSGGKDSAVLLYLVATLCPTVAARTLTSGETRLLHADWDTMLSYWQSRFPDMDYREICVDRVFSSEWSDSDWHTQRKAGKGDIVRELPTSGDFDGVFMGLRDEESNARRFANKRGLIRQYSVARADSCAGMYVCCPLAYWKTADIGAFHVLHNIPLLAEYERAGLTARTTARLTGDAMRQNGLQSLRLRDPATYHRLMQRFPEVSWWNG